MEVLINKDNVRHSTETFLPFEAEEVMDLAIAGERNYRIINPTLHAPPHPLLAGRGGGNHLSHANIALLCCCGRKKT